MSGTGNSILVPLAGPTTVGWGPTRRGEPVTTGLSLPAGAVRSTAEIGLQSAGGRPAPLQARALDHWPDGSIRWVLLDLLADANSGRADPVSVVIGPTEDIQNRQTTGQIRPALAVRPLADGVEVSTGRAMFRLAKGQSFPLWRVEVDGVEVLDTAASGFRIVENSRAVDFVIADVSVHLDGPLRAEIDVRAIARGAESTRRLEISARLEFFADCAAVRFEFTIRNPERAMHQGGRWPLGDSGSILIQAAELNLATRFQITALQAAIEHGRSLEPGDLPFEVHQESSGGERWDSAVHQNRRGIVPLRFRGYRQRSGHVELAGLRATPVVVAAGEKSLIAVAVPRFWQNFPQAIAVDPGAIRIGFLPRDAGDLHELQGGEQKTWRAVIAFGPDAVSDPPLAWCHQPLALHPSPEWSCGTRAVPFLVPAQSDRDPGYLALVNMALDPERGFVAKREQFDEFGWRNFGDLPADHESAFQPADRPFASHYNNQYDAIAGFACHFLRTGDRRWYELMDDLARHVRDIDRYHTIEDKAAYNGGLFWHTYHYADAGTSTHRTYPKGLEAGGGPSAEHNYTIGLMLHYFLTGERASRDAVIGLATWVLDMDDGRLTPFRWLASGPTGYASATGSPDYHGPGRGAANSIVACRSAFRLTGDARFASKAEEIIRRCIHPRDDLEARNLLDTERRWYYTVFLQTLGAYLHDKLERGERDGMFEYAEASLLHYARWMAGHERPYLDRPEVLEYPTETWVAQDLRKADVFWWAARQAMPEERERFLERARFFFQYAVKTLASMPTRHFTRPIVLVLTNGLRASQPPDDRDASAQARSLPSAFPKAMPFTPQKTQAIARAKWLALAVAASAVIATLIALG